jgi:hypothetical protein
MMVSVGDVMSRAYSAYFRWTAREGCVLVQPGSASGVEEVGDKKYAVLRSVKGILAVYRVRLDGSLKRLRRWPKALEE